MKRRKKKYCSKCKEQITTIKNKISNREYSGYCPYCDEDLYKFEITRTYKKK